MLTSSRDFLLGLISSLLGIIVLEGLALWWTLRQNRAFKISQIQESAHETVEKLSDDQLRKQLNDELGPR
jgi:uncharacterized iron-regulated membrane protein